MQVLGLTLTPGDIITMEGTRNAPSIDWIRDRVNTVHYYISEHVIKFLMAGKISVREIEDAVFNGKIIEIRRNMKRGDSALVAGYSGKKPVHVMCADGKDDWLVILFAYIPSPPIWDDPEHRAQQGEKPMDSVARNCFFCGGKIKKITMGNFDYRLEGSLYVIKNVPAGLCLQCGEKYIT
ncbi:MAG: hypothetical protein DRH50_13390, partial [Deltaproteobacteria bacterium]